jgi:hypothetical protein
MGIHTGGYDRFSYDITSALKAKNNELLIYVYDPSDIHTKTNKKTRKI